MSRKVLFLHSSSDLYGASRIFLQTILYLKSQGVIPFVIVSDKGPLVDVLEKNDVKVHFVRLGVLRRKYMNPIGLINRFFFLFRAIINIRKVIKEESIDLVYNNASSIISGLISSRICNVPHLWHVHEIIVSPSWFAKLISKLLSLSDKVLVVSHATKAHWISLHKRLERKIHVIHNGLNSEYLAGIGKSSFQQIKNDYRADVWIGMIARVHFWKGQTYFLEIAKEIADRHDNVMFLMAGDAYPGYEYLYEEIKDKIEELSLKERVVDLGLVKDSRDFYPLIDIMVLPSILPDPLPTTCLEAMAHALPVVATNHGGAVEMVQDEVTGILIPPDNSRQAYDLMERLISDSDFATNLGLAGRRRLEAAFSIEKYNQELIQLIESGIRKNED